MKITVRPCLANEKRVVINRSGTIRANNKCVTRIGQLDMKLGGYPKKWNIVGKYPSILLEFKLLCGQNITGYMIR